MNDFVQPLIERIKSAQSDRAPLAIHGGNSKAFYGGAIRGDALDVRPYTGIIDYEPKELVLTVRAGTPLAEIEAAMTKQNQMLPFEPPYFSEGATIGGTVATGLSGPRRPYTGAVRDFVLGTRVINGKGEDLRFGGRVIKNVAGYDVSRLMTGAMGTLGVLLDLSFKVLPKPTEEMTLRFQMDEATSIQRFNEWAGRPLPISATSWCDGVAMLRLSGAAAGVRAARKSWAVKWSRNRKPVNSGATCVIIARIFSAARNPCGGSRYRPPVRRFSSTCRNGSSGAVRCAGCVVWPMRRHCAQPWKRWVDTQPCSATAINRRACFIRCNRC